MYRAVCGFISAPIIFSTHRPGETSHAYAGHGNRIGMVRRLKSLEFVYVHADPL